MFLRFFLLQNRNKYKKETLFCPLQTNSLSLNLFPVYMRTTGPNIISNLGHRTFPFVTFMTSMRILSAPQPLVNDPWSLFYPLPTAAWVLLLAATSASLFTVHCMALVYERIHIMKKQNNNLTLKMIGSLTEPDSLSFFPSWTAGNIIINVHVIKSHLILQVIQMSEPRYKARIFDIRVKLMT